MGEGVFLLPANMAPHNSLSRLNRNQKAKRCLQQSANFDDPLMHIRLLVPASTGAKDKNLGVQAMTARQALGQCALKETNFFVQMVSRVGR
jgi:hypothetical protein